MSWRDAASVKIKETAQEIVEQVEAVLDEASPLPQPVLIDLRDDTAPPAERP